MRTVQPARPPTAIDVAFCFMVVRYALTGTALADVRFGISPLNELVLSLRSWREPGRYPLHLPWIRRTRPLHGQLDTEMLQALVSSRRWVPDFLTRQPSSPLTRFEEELARLESVPAATVRRDVAATYPGDEPVPEVLQGRNALRRMISALEEYWQLCFAPDWPRMRAVLEADVTYRGRQIAQHGLATMFADLSDRVRMDGDTVEVQSGAGPDWIRPADQGLTLVPSLWTSAACVPVSPDEPPTIIYLPRGRATLWESAPLPTSEALAGVLGSHRAALLQRLAAPASSTELALGLGVTPTAVNQHLRALRAAGLLVAVRHGRSVLYRRSDLAEQLLAASGAQASGVQPSVAAP
ncbi:ArsR/SmtB family transcription factor [Kineosporia babensis]|uniref:Helix-turn-helix domain-containing protein n=1 Tax=Kineosporia babensis TaxID=499548 RepID=A0A9X1T0N2_9ACTN|nr:helix-turn-helix domain-containing protein [Kineosporia babensis]MCD5312928.1 helix-turn-helix domain-containing protein [Kineosporia babensis]